MPPKCGNRSSPLLNEDLDANFSKNPDPKKKTDLILKRSWSAHGDLKPEAENVTNQFQTLESIPIPQKIMHRHR